MRRAPLLALALLAGPALAQEDDQPGNTRYADETVLDEDAFRELGITAPLLWPGGVALHARGDAAKFAVLFRLRKDFDEEMSESVDAIR